MIKNLSGGSVINYGPTLPTDATSFDGSLFYKTSGSNQGLFIFGFTQDANLSLVGDQSAQSWTQIQNPGLYVSKNGDQINGALAVTGGGAAADPYGHVSVTLPTDTNSYSYFGLTRQSSMGWSIGIDTSNRLFFGNGSGSLTNTINRPITFDSTGGIGINGNAVWHAGNDGLGSGLDAGLFGGQPPSFYSNAANISTGTLDATRLPFPPVQQGGGTGQQPNKIYIGWSTNQLFLQVDSSNFSNNWPINVTGSAATANYASSAGSAASAPWASITGKPTKLTDFTNDLAFIGSTANVWQNSTDGVQRFLFNGATTTYGASQHNFSGNVNVTGNIVASGNVTAYSDRRIKKNIVNIPDALNKLLTLNGVVYDRTDSEERGTGLIAQEVQAILPEAVVEQAFDGMLSVAYGNLVGLLVESIKELNGQVQAMKEEIAALKGGGQ